MNISKSLSSDRKMHLTILKQHGEELLYNFHEELEIKMKNCLILCKNAIILRSDTLDSIESKIDKVLLHDRKSLFIFLLFIFIIIQTDHHIFIVINDIDNIYILQYV